MKYKTEVFLYGNGFNKTVADYIKEGWAVLKIWQLSKEIAATQQIIVTFSKPKDE